MTNIIFFPSFNYSVDYNSLLVVKSIYNLNFRMNNINFKNIYLKFENGLNNLIKNKFSYLLYIDSINAIV